MTQEQTIKHKEIIKWWLDNSEKGVWFQNYKSDKWHLSYNPAFVEFNTYVQNDEYAEFRKALADGKTIQGTINNGNTWIENVSFCKEFDYRIKPDEPLFKVGDWVNNTQFNFQITSTHLQGQKHPENWKLWEPTEGEWICEWDNRYSRQLIIFQYNGVSMKYYMPLEYAQTLKDK